MTSKRHPLKVRLIRLSDTFSDAIGLRPLGILVFASSAVMFLHIIGLSSETMRAEGVAVASLVDHPSRVSSFATRIFVKLGDRVEVGQPLVELSAHFVDQELARVDLEMDQLVYQSNLSRMRPATAAAQPTPVGSTADRLTAAYFERRLEAIEMRRARLLEDRDSLVVTASYSGIVSQVTWLGASIDKGASVASVMPEFAEEIVAYLPPSRDSWGIENGIATYIVGARAIECRSPGQVRNRGAAVERAPGQLKQFLGGAVHGMPIHITIPNDCRLVNGQVLAVRFLAAVEK